MAKQTVNVGTAADAEDGDALRTAFQKLNSNSDELYAANATLTSAVNERTRVLIQDTQPTATATDRILWINMSDQVSPAQYWNGTVWAQLPFGWADTAPDAYSFPPVVGAALDTPVVSAAVTPVGYNSTTNISITGGQYRINGGAWTALAGYLDPGDQVEVQVQSSPSNSTAVSATLTVGGVQAAFSVTTLAASLQYTELSPMGIPRSVYGG